MESTPVLRNPTVETNLVRGEAMALLRTLKAEMHLGNLVIGSTSKRLSNGTVIKCSIAYGIEEVSVELPVTEDTSGIFALLNVTENTINWIGGVGPFQVLVVRYVPETHTLTFDVTDNQVNIAADIVDGSGVLVGKTSARSFTITKEVDTDDWWADDLDTDSLYQQDHIGLAVIETTGRKRWLLVPFTPAPNTQYAEMYSHYGPPVKATPSILWVDQLPIAYKALLTNVQLCARVYIPGTETNLAGTFTYNPPLSTELQAGVRILSVTFNATDSIHYNGVSKSVNITVNKILADLTATNVTVSYDTLVHAINYTITPVGTPVDIVYSSDTPYYYSGVAPTIPGVYTATLTVNSSNYYGQVTGTVTINKLPQVVGYPHEPYTAIIGVTVNVPLTYNIESGNPTHIETTRPDLIHIVKINNGSYNITILAFGNGFAEFRAYQEGNAYYSVSEILQQGVFTQKKSQTLGNMTAHDELLFYNNIHYWTHSMVTASSGLTPVYTSLTPSICQLEYMFEENGVAGYQNGTCTIAVNQIGNDEYDPAPQKTVSFTITGAGAPPPLTNMVITSFEASNITWTNGEGPFTIAFYGLTVASNITWASSGVYYKSVVVRKTDPALPWYATTGGIRITDSSTNTPYVVDVPFSSMINGPPGVVAGIIGTWHGSYGYWNTVGYATYHTITYTFTFYANGSVSFITHDDGLTSYYATSCFSGTYTVSGGNVTIIIPYQQSSCNYLLAYVEYTVITGYYLNTYTSWNVSIWGVVVTLTR